MGCELKKRKTNQTIEHWSSTTHQHHQPIRKLATAYNIRWRGCKSFSPPASGCFASQLTNPFRASPWPVKSKPMVCTERKALLTVANTGHKWQMKDWWNANTNIGCTAARDLCTARYIVRESWNSLSAIEQSAPRQTKKNTKNAHLFLMHE